jgi:ribose transport system permease protein
MGTIAVGLIQVQTGGSFSGDAPSWLIKLASPGTDTFGIDIPPMVVIWAGVAVLMALFLHRTTPGRRLMATGANPRAASYSLIKTRWVWTLAFAFSGVTSALVGLLIGGFAGSVDSAVGDPYLFQSVVAVIVGGTVFGGPGDYTRTVVGALFLTVVNVVLVGKGAIPADQNIIYGVAILFAVALYGRERRLRDRV